MKHYLLTAIFTFFLNIAYCCTCTMYPLESQLNSTESVVTVKVVELLEEDTNYQIERLYPEKRSYRAKVKIIQGFKGSFEAEEIIIIDSQYGNCYPEFAMNEEYLLFVNKEGGKYINDVCTYWGLVSDSKKRIRKIEKLLKKENKRTPTTE